MGSQVNRRRTVALALGLFALATSVAGLAQPAERMRRIGVLSLARSAADSIKPVSQRLQQLGYIEGKHYSFEVRLAEGKPERLAELAAELVRMNVDVIWAIANVSAFAAKSATRTIPIVVWGAHGALETGLVQSLARPGGNLTGLESLAPALDAKRMELLKEIVPGLSRVDVLYNAGDQGSQFHLRAARSAGEALGVSISTLEVRRPEDFDTALSSAAGKLPEALLTFTDTLTLPNWKRVAEFAVAKRVPTMCEFKQMVQAGCLVSYGPSFTEFAEINARQIARIFDGGNPGEMPVERCTRFELVVNLKIARVIGISIPQSVLLRADEVIQ
jgi:putative ABC transport system substrate-binding protein